MASAPKQKHLSDHTSEGGVEDFCSCEIVLAVKGRRKSDGTCHFQNSGFSYSTFDIKSLPHHLQLSDLRGAFE